MSWTNFHHLIASGNRNANDWNAAIRANPNDPASALKVALLTIYDDKDVGGLENFCEAVIAMLNQEGKQ